MKCVIHFIMGVMLITMALGFSPNRAISQLGEDREIIKWPSGEYPTLQSAINVVPDGGVLVIAEGEYYIEEPVFVFGKRIVIKGAGSGLIARGDIRRGVEVNLKRYKLYEDRSGRTTHLIGPSPRPVLNERREVILHADMVDGLFNFIGSEAIVRDLRISGFDAGIVTKDDDRGGSASSTIDNVIITETGRGILSLSSSDITVNKSLIQGTRWHGIIVSPPPGTIINKAMLKDCLIKDPDGADAYFNNTWGIVMGGEYTGGKDGGVVCYECYLSVLGAHIHDNYGYGILLLLAKGTPQINGNVIQRTNHSFFTEGFGDGITSFFSNVNIWGNLIEDSHRSGFTNIGGDATLGNNLIQCSGYDLGGGKFLGYDFHFNDALGNQCGCPVADGSCTVESAGLAPPEPTAPIE